MFERMVRQKQKGGISSSSSSGSRLQSMKKSRNSIDDDNDNNDVPVIIYDGSSGGARGFHQNKASAKEWRLFMSPKASDVLKEAAPVAATAQEEDNDEAFSMEFRNILKEVEQLGNSTLSWKDHKKQEQEKLVALGAKPVKSFKMPINMGLNIKRKREKLEEENRSQGYEVGSAPAKRLNGEKKLTFWKRTEQRGLQASEGTFKGGILYVKPPSAAPKETSFRKRAGGDAFFNSEGSKGKKAGAGKSKKKGKGKKPKGKRKKH
ncbi:unnamed protein product [Sphagnum compactum]